MNAALVTEASVAPNGAWQGIWSRRVRYMMVRWGEVRWGGKWKWKWIPEKNPSPLVLLTFFLFLQSIFFLLSDPQLTPKLLICYDNIIFCPVSLALSPLLSSGWWWLMCRELTAEFQDLTMKRLKSCCQWVLLEQTHPTTVIEKDSHTQRNIIHTTRALPVECTHG